VGSCHQRTHLHTGRIAGTDFKAPGTFDNARQHAIRRIAHQHQHGDGHATFTGRTEGRPGHCIGH
jgi:hypothetical protein